MVPYSASVAPRILTLEPGFARVAIRDRRAVRNHLNSIHAIALANVGELASGLALISTLPADVQGIVVSLKVDYMKKARGTLVAASRSNLPHVGVDTEHVATAHVTDESGETVAQIFVTWRLRKSSTER